MVTYSIECIVSAPGQIGHVMLVVVYNDHGGKPSVQFKIAGEICHKSVKEKKPDLHYRLRFEGGSHNQVYLHE